MKNKRFKKALSVFLSVLMLMSCWVWVAPEKATAAADVAPATTYATYHVKLTAKFENIGNSGHIIIYYYPVNADGSLNTSVRGEYVLVNSAAKYSSTTWTFNTADDSTRRLSTDTGAETGPVQGWPYGVKLKSVSSASLTLTGLTIGNKSVVLTGGSWGAGSGNTKEVLYNNTGSGWDGYLDWPQPAVATLSKPADLVFDAPEIGSGSNVLKTTTSTAYDQYGVKRPGTSDMSPGYGVVSANGADGFDRFDMTTSGGVGTINVQINENVQKNLAAGSGDGKLIYNIWATCDGVSSEKATVTINCPKYDIVYNNVAGSTVYTQPDVGYYNGTYTTIATPATNTVTKSNGAGVNDTHTVYSWPAAETYTITGHKTVNEIATNSAHEWNSGVVTSDSTCTSTGTKTYTCTICGQTRTEEVPLKDHTPGAEATCTDPQTCTVCGTVLEAAKGHTPGAEATCTTPQTCTICGTELESAKGHTPGVAATCEAPQTCTVCGEVLAAQLAHTPGPAATCTAPQTCTVCGEVLAAQLAHTEVVIPAVAATCTTPGKTEGKKCSVCGAITVAQQDTDLAAHTEATRNENVTNATCGQEGSYERVTYCSVCNAELGRETVTVDKLAHTEEVIPAVAATCTKTGLTEGKKCSVCGEILVVQQETPMIDHNYSDWTVNGNNHTRTCTACSKTESEAHSFTTDRQPKADSTSLHDYKCSVCTARGALVGGTPTLGGGEYCYANATCTSIEGNNSNHTVTCECSRTKEAAHNSVEVEGTYVAPNCLDKGSQGYKCNDCGYIYTKEIAALGHKYATEFTVDVEPKCETVGSKSRHCVRCDDKIEITEIPALQHDYELTDHKDATCEDTGYDTYTCKNDSSHGYSETIPATGHNYGAWTYDADGNHKRVCANDASHVETEACADTETDNDCLCDKCSNLVAHNYGEASCDAPATCTVCGATTGDKLGHDWEDTTYNFAADGKSCTATRECQRENCDVTETATAEIASAVKTPATCIEKGTTTYTATFSVDWAAVQYKDVKDIAIDADNHTKLNKTDAVEETCEKDGNIDYWTCEGCKKIYRDAEATQEITEAETVVAAKKHNYGAWTYDADGNHKRVCSNDASHVETEACADTETDNDCLCDKCSNLVAHNYGEASCDAPATCTVCGATTGDKLGHDWADTTYNFAADGKSCTATRECQRENCDVTETATAEITSAVKTPATCIEKGTTTYTATFSVDWAAVQTKDVIDIPAKNHAWTVSYEWSEDGKTCTATRECGNDATHNVTAKATITSEEKIAATCEGMGTTTYTATFTEDWAAEQTKDVRDIPAKNHAWTVSYAWSEDGKTCTATRACGNDATHNVTAKATITSEEKIAATCEGMGTTTYTATFTEDWAAEQTKDVIDIPAKNHDYDETKSEANLTRPVLVDGVWQDGYYTYTCRNDSDHKTTEKVSRATYTEYDKAVEELNKLLNNDKITDAAKSEIQEALNGNKVNDNLIESEQSTIDTATTALNAVLDKIAKDTTGAYEKVDYTNYNGAVSAYENLKDTITTEDQAAVDAIKAEIEKIPADGSKKDYQTQVDEAAADIAAINAKYGECASGNHDWNAGEVSEAPTCKAEGTRLFTCQICGTTKTETIETVDHKFESYVGNDDATCQKNATETAECAFCCGETDTREIADSKVGHKYETYVGNHDATCQKNETETAECAFGCGETDTREIADSKVDHKYETYTGNDDATCQKNETETAECAFGCGTKDTRDIENSTVDHSFTNYVSDNNAECEKDGTKTALCDYGCGETDTVIDAGSATDHDYDETKSEANLTRPELVDGVWQDGYYTYICKNDSDHTTTEKVSRADYTANENAVADLNDLLADENLTDAAKKDITDALANNVADNLITTEQDKVNAATDALNEILNKIANDTTGAYEKPDYSGAEQAIKDAENIPDLEDADKEDLEDLKKELQEIKDKKNPDANAKDDQDDIDAIKDAVKDIITKHEKCRHIGTSRRVVSHLNGTHSIQCVVCDETIETVSCTYTVTEVGATCQSVGYTLHECDVCSYSYKDNENGPTDHDWSQWYINEGTCKDVSTQTRYCDSEGCFAQETVIRTDSNGNKIYGAHTMVVVNGKPATCTTDGHTDYSRCIICDQVTESEILPATGHSDNNHNGNCDRCNYLMNASGKCGCFCHNNSFFGKLLYRFVNFFWKLFKINKNCECGSNHW